MCGPCPLSPAAGQGGSRSASRTRIAFGFDGKEAQWLAQKLDELSLLDDHDKDIPINGSLKKQTHLPAAELVEKLDGLPLIGGRDALFSSFTEEDYKNTRIDKKIVDTWNFNFFSYSRL